MTALLRLPRQLYQRLFREAVRQRAIGRHYLAGAFPPRLFRSALRGYPRYLRDRRRYTRLVAPGELDRYDDNPQLHDWTPSSPFDPHYTYQDAWAAREIHAAAPGYHVDVGSRVTFVIGLAAFVRTVFIDLRPLEVDIPNLEPRAGSILDLPFDDASVASLSCLHVAEHIGLGRYGDPLDPEGTVKAARELARVLAPGGALYFALPIGRQRTEFNAHRVHDPRAVPAMFADLELVSFAAVGDDGRYAEPAELEDYAESDWSCGLYMFTRR